MAYVPPKYPSQIPTIGDLPNRADDVDWMYAARYNELKKELRAIMIELGVDPAGASATVVARLDALGGGFTDRGDPAAFDYDIGDFTLDLSWYDLDLSGIVPAGAKAVLLFWEVRSAVANAYVYLRENGNSNEFNKAGVLTQVAGITLLGSLVVACDTNRVIEYKGKNVEFTKLNMTIRGWWE